MNPGCPVSNISDYFSFKIQQCILGYTVVSVHITVHTTVTYNVVCVQVVPWMNDDGRTFETLSVFSKKHKLLLSKHQ